MSDTYILSTATAKFAGQLVERLLLGRRNPWNDVQPCCSAGDPATESSLHHLNVFILPFECVSFFLVSCVLS